MPHSIVLHVRLEEDVKAQASEVLAAMGLSVSDAVRILLKRVIQDQAFPLELKVPNAATRAAMRESRAKLKVGKARFAAGADPIFNMVTRAGMRVGLTIKPTPSVRVRSAPRQGSIIDKRRLRA